MSRSRRRTKITSWTTSCSEKKDKQLANRKMRKKIKEQIKKEKFDKPFPHKYEIEDNWNWAKDGKAYQKNMTEEDMRK